MDCIEVSIKTVKEKCNTLNREIREDYNYDLVIFIATGSYIIGEYLSKENNIPLLEITAKRKGKELKKMLKPIIKLIPKKALTFLREKEMNSSFHNDNVDRSIKFDEKTWKLYKDKKKILIVDDSIDTGHTMKQVRESVKGFFDKAEVRIATFNYMTKAKDIIEPDYSVYEDKMIIGPWSNDSKENNEFLILYEQYQ